MKTGIYKITNKKTKKIYIGSSINVFRRWVEHKVKLNKNTHINNKLQNSWNKYGDDNFTFSIIEECEKDQLIVREQFYLDKLLKSSDPDSFFFNKMGYNILTRAGNTLGYKFSESTKNKMSKIKSDNGKLLDKDFSDFNNLTPQKIKTEIVKSVDTKNPFFGKKHSEKAKLIMSEKKMGNKNFNYGKGPMLGKKLTELHKDKIRISNTGKNNPNSKQVYQYTTDFELIKVWDSVGLLCKSLNLSVGNISSCCLGNRKTAYGFIWKYEIM
jgi:group I intron endonuclease